MESGCFGPAAGGRTAAAVPQAYVGFPAAVGEPPNRLFGWSKIWLRPGQHRRVTLAITDSALDYWRAASNRWALATGRYPIWVGFSNAKLQLAGELQLGKLSARRR
jgi:beta-glucosidase